MPLAGCSFWRETPATAIRRPARNSATARGSSTTGETVALLQEGRELHFSEQREAGRRVGNRSAIGSAHHETAAFVEHARHFLVLLEGAAPAARLEKPGVDLPIGALAKAVGHLALARAARRWLVAEVGVLHGALDPTARRPQ